MTDNKHMIDGIEPDNKIYAAMPKLKQLTGMKAWDLGLYICEHNIPEITALGKTYYKIDDFRHIIDWEHYD